MSLAAPKRVVERGQCLLLSTCSAGKKSAKSTWPALDHHVFQSDDV